LICSTSRNIFFTQSKTRTKCQNQYKKMSVVFILSYKDVARD